MTIPVLPLSAAVSNFRAYVMAMELSPMPMIADDRDLSDQRKRVERLGDLYADLIASVVGDANASCRVAQLDAGYARNSIVDAMGDGVLGQLSEAVRDEQYERESYRRVA